jgi:hypothetical protein
MNMTMNHATMTTQVTRLPRNDFGMPLLGDAPTNEDWWSQRDDAPDTRLEPIKVCAGTLNFDATLLDLKMPKGIREPDLYDDGKAVWLTADAVVSMDMDQVQILPLAIAQDERAGYDRLRVETLIAEGMTGIVGWTRIHPSQYGIEVDSFHEHHGEVASHAAHEAWDLLAKAVSA